MRQHMAMDHPLARIVSHEGNFDGFIRPDQHGVAHVAFHVRGTALGQDGKVVTMQVDCV